MTRTGDTAQSELAGAPKSRGYKAPPLGLSMSDWLSLIEAVQCQVPCMHAV